MRRSLSFVRQENIGGLTISGQQQVRTDSYEIQYLRRARRRLAANIYSVNENTDTVSSDGRRRQLYNDAAIKFLGLVC